MLRAECNVELEYEIFNCFLNEHVWADSAQNVHMLRLYYELYFAIIKCDERLYSPQSLGLQICLICVCTGYSGSTH